MLIKQINTIIKADNSTCARGSESLCGQEDISPIVLHPRQRRLNIVFFTSTFTNSADFISELVQVHIDTVLESESFIWFDFKADRS